MFSISISIISITSILSIISIIGIISIINVISISISVQFLIKGVDLVNLRSCLLLITSVSFDWVTARLDNFGTIS